MRLIPLKKGQKHRDCSQASINFFVLHRNGRNTHFTSNNVKMKVTVLLLPLYQAVHVAKISVRLRMKT